MNKRSKPKAGRPRLSGARRFTAALLTPALIASGLTTVTLAALTATAGPASALDQPVVQLDSLDSLAGWSSSGNSTLSLDTTDKKEGTASLVSTGTGQDWFEKSFSTPVDSTATRDT